MAQSQTPAEILKSVFGHDQFRGTQAEIIERVLGEKHCLVIMLTGMGKSICFQVPALVHARSPQQDTEHAEHAGVSLTLVISPLIALMKDQVDALVSKGVDAAFVNSSLTRPQLSLIHI